MRTSHYLRPCSNYGGRNDAKRATRICPRANDHLILLRARQVRVDPAHPALGLHPKSGAARPRDEVNHPALGLDTVQGDYLRMHTEVFNLINLQRYTLAGYAIPCDTHLYKIHYIGLSDKCLSKMYLAMPVTSRGTR